MSAADVTVEDLLRMVAEGIADAFTYCAAIIRDSEATYTADQVADLITTISAHTCQSAAEYFGGAS